MQFKPHDRVVIGGRTMLRPGYSLVGMSATVFAVGGFVPTGHVQVLVDGEVVEEDGASRVLIVNVPAVHLEPLTPAAEPELKPAQPEPAPAFTMVDKQKPAKTKNEAPSPPAEPEDASGPGDGEKPFGLRLV